MRGELLDKFGIFICDLKVSSLILFKEQSHPGRCIVAYKDHVSEIVDISEEERRLFFEDVAHAAKAIHAAFHPDKLNYGAYGDTGCHLHMHLCIKKRVGYLIEHHSGLLWSVRLLCAAAARKCSRCKHYRQYCYRYFPSFHNHSSSLRLHIYSM